MNLSAEERSWLDAFVRGLRRLFPGQIERILVYGSKARGDARPDSDVDVLVIVQGDTVPKYSVRLLGYELALEKDVVASVLVYTVQEIEKRREDRSVFVEAVERDGVVVS